jgi:predicted O-methyltransferase YrrM
MTIKDRLVRTARGIGTAIKRPPYFPPGNFYSTATSMDDRRRAISQRELMPIPPIGIDMRAGEQLNLAAEIGLTTVKRYPAAGRVPPRYHEDNSMYGLGDAVTLALMLRRFKPKRIIEVGSGWSTAVMLDIADEMTNPPEITCIEPNPQRLDSVLLEGDEVERIVAPVQDVEIERFGELEAGDVLFIDSTHVSKAGSDVNWLYLYVLPSLAPGVLVHVHDVDYPFEYPWQWIREGRDWNEIYMLAAFLTQNYAWEIRLMTRWLWTQHPGSLPEWLRVQPTGSLWMQRV